jgi:hypothetical protein
MRELARFGSVKESHAASLGSVRQTRQVSDVSQVRDSFRAFGELTAAITTIEPDRPPPRIESSLDVVIDLIANHDWRSVIGKRTECVVRSVKCCPSRLGRG